ncbi:hypothetical protein O3M35_010741 [Rhynocoris fuscipes]|uniref:Uncharacterized protein n=1 Tax=Rhynocoris fuscipes TaxID=488301 RepID=A0AAW1D126_9HEMI
MVTSKNADILRIPIIAMQIVVMWPLNISSKIVTFLMRMYLIISSTSLGICSVGLLLKTVKTTDLVDRSEAIDIFTLTLSAMYKQLFIINNYNKLHSLTVNANKLDCPDGWMAYSQLLAIGHCIGGFTAISFWWSCPILKLVFGDTALSEMRLPINVDFIITFSGWKFVATFLFCTFGLVVAVHIYMAMDCYLFTCVHIANGALKKLSQRIRDLRQYFRKL